MDFFPIKKITINISSENSDTFSKLKSSTEHSDKLITTLTSKPFIGQVTDNSFKIISSKIGIGAIAVFQFDSNKNKNEIYVTLNKAFKILFLFFVSFISIGVIIGIIQTGIPKGLILFIPFVFSVLMFRFVLIGVAFKVSTKLGEKALNKVIGVIKN